MGQRRNAFTQWGSMVEVVVFDAVVMEACLAKQCDAAPAYIESLQALAEAMCVSGLVETRDTRMLFMTEAQRHRDDVHRARREV